MRKIGAILFLLFSASLAVNVTYRNPYVGYDWTVPSDLIADSSGSGYVLGHSLRWPAGPVGIVGTIVQEINSAIFSSPNAWAFEEATEDKYLFEAYDPSFEISYVAYFDSIVHEGIPGYVLGAVFKIWDDPNVYFQEFRYLGYNNGLGLEIFLLTDTADACLNYGTYDSIMSLVRYAIPTMGITPLQTGIRLESSASSYVRRFFALQHSGSLNFAATDVLGRKARRLHNAIGIYMVREVGPK